MAKAKKLFYCTQCGNELTKWEGKCPACGVWGTIDEAPADYGKNKAGVFRGNGRFGERTPISKVNAETEVRTDTGIEELNRVLGGGIVKGSLILVGGDPGIGKSTLLLQMCRSISMQDRSVLYVSGEESLKQIKLRADRIGDFPDTLELLSDTNFDYVVSQIYDMRPEVVIIDSIQTMCREDVDSAAGSPGQIREITQSLLKIAKEEDITVFIIGHVTKEGTVAGPRMLEHMVDTVLYFEGENSSLFRILRAVKNRFGSTNEIAVFEMRQAGLAEVKNPSEHMLCGRPENEPGTVVTVVMEGTRPLMLEVQALICQTSFNMPRRTAAGIDYNRMNLLLAVMEKKMGIRLSGCDAYVNIAGGIRVSDPSIDLSMIMAIFSGFLNKPMDEKTVVFGEVGLIGEVRAVSQVSARVSEAEKLGYKKCILPAACVEQLKAGGKKFAIELIGIKNIYELKKLF